MKTLLSIEIDEMNISSVVFDVSNETEAKCLVASLLGMMADNEPVVTAFSMAVDIYDRQKDEIKNATMLGRLSAMAMQDKNKS